MFRSVFSSRIFGKNHLLPNYVPVVFSRKEHSLPRVRRFGKVPFHGDYGERGGREEV